MSTSVIAQCEGCT